jgi:NAD(P)H-nitrite reductase large subunit
MIICRCNDVTQQEIKKFLSKKPHASFDDLKLATGASSGCGRCNSLLKKTYENLIKNTPPEKQYRINF